MCGTDTSNGGRIPPTWIQDSESTECGWIHQWMEGILVMDEVRL